MKKNENSNINYSVFISYRHKSGDYLARQIKEFLDNKGYSVYMDIEGLKSGPFNKELFLKIENATDFILVLTKDCLQRCKNENDWLRHEIAYAYEHDKNIIPVYAEGFEMPNIIELPDDIKQLCNQHAITAHTDVLEASMKRLASNFLKSQPQNFLQQFINKNAKKIRYVVYLLLLSILPIYLLNKYNNSEDSNSNNKLSLNFSDSKNDNNKKSNSIDNSNKWIRLAKLDANIRSTFFLDHNIGWVVGDQGCAFKTTDGGKTWIKKEIQSDVILRDVFFIDKENGWIVGGNSQKTVLDALDRIFKTTDGGETWVSYKNQTWAPNLTSVFFTDKTKGWAVGDGQGMILRTLDGGDSWHIIPTSAKLVRNTKLFFVNDKVGYKIGSSGVSKTIDGGNTWISGGVGQWLYSIFFINSMVGWTGGEGGQFYKTLDGGSTWNQKNIFHSSVNIQSIIFINENIGWIGGTGIGIAKTLDGGNTWSKEIIGINSNLINSVYFIDEKTGWATDFTGIIYKWCP